MRNPQAEIRDAEVESAELKGPEILPAIGRRDFHLGTHDAVAISWGTSCVEDSVPRDLQEHHMDEQVYRILIDKPLGHECAG